MKAVLVETFGYSVGNSKRLLAIPQEGLRLHIEHGNIIVIGPESRCKICNGSGAIVYHFDQDDSTAALCPRCNGGSQEKWDALKKQWEEHCSAT